VTNFRVKLIFSKEVCYKVSSCEKLSVAEL